MRGIQTAFKWFGIRRLFFSGLGLWVGVQIICGLFAPWGYNLLAFCSYSSRVQLAGNYVESNSLQ